MRKYLVFLLIVVIGEVSSDEIDILFILGFLNNFYVFIYYVKKKYTLK